MAVTYEPPAHPGIARIDLDRSEMVYVSRELARPVPLASVRPDRLIAMDPRDPLGSLLQAALAGHGVSMSTALQVNRCYMACAMGGGAGCGDAIVDAYSARGTRRARPFHPPPGPAGAFPDRRPGARGRPHRRRCITASSIACAWRARRWHRRCRPDQRHCPAGRMRGDRALAVRQTERRRQRRGCRRGRRQGGRHGHRYCRPRPAPAWT